MFKAPAFQLYAKEFLQDEAVIAMDLDAVGTYIVLLCHQWIEGSIPSEPALLAKICRTTAERIEKIWPQVAIKFTASRHLKNRLVNRKLEMVRAEKVSFSGKQSESGKRGADKRWADKDPEISEVTGLPHHDAMGNPKSTLKGTDGSGSGTGSVYTPLTPLVEGDGAGAPLVLVPPEANTRAPKPAVSQKPYGNMLGEVARSIHSRHPNGHGRRDLGIAGIAKKLEAILKHKHLIGSDCEPYLRQIDRNHAGMCAAADWLKDGGQFAKSLRNYLAPTEERYEVELSASMPKEPVRLMA